MRAFDDLEEGVRLGLRRLRENPLLKTRDAIRGFILEVESGELREVV